jgi:REP element-mobilizing transposase RayT
MGLGFKVTGSGYLWYVTTTVVDFTQVFFKEKYILVLIENLKYYREQHDFKLIAYVIMPEHIHLIIWLLGKSTISDVMKDFKKYSSVRIREELYAEGNKKLISIFRNCARGYKGQDFKLWMDRFDRVAIYTPRVLKQKIDYIHLNPVRRNLVKDILDWKYSSARNYYLNDHSVIKVDTDSVLS